jgi:allophanate hydrolase
VAERYAAIEPFFTQYEERIDPVVRRIIGGAQKFSAIDAFKAQYRLQALRQRCDAVWKEIDVLALPTTGTIYRIDEVEANPVELNTHLGYYTNFVNLLDLAAVAVPAQFREDGLPAGVTFVAPALEDATLMQWCARFHRAVAKRLGATAFELPEASSIPVETSDAEVTVAVVGAHLSGMPLNHQLTSRSARLLETCSTAPDYRLYALPGATPPKPGLARIKAGAGSAIEVELWSMPLAQFGAFVAEIPPPLAIGTVALADGRHVKSFVCEGIAIQGARDISAFGGWRAFVKAEG